jgi:hypothetical protein
MRRAALFAFALLLAPPPPARAAERLLVPELRGWQVIATHNDSVADVTELVPGTESAEAWSRRLTVQAYRGTAMTVTEFLDGLVPRTREVCDGFAAGPIVPEAVAGADGGGRRTIACGNYRGDGRGSFTLFYAIRGRAALYVLARAWRGARFAPPAPPISASELADWNATFDGVRLCDTDDPARPCPEAPAP